MKEERGFPTSANIVSQTDSYKRSKEQEKRQDSRTEPKISGHKGGKLGVRSTRSSKRKEQAKTENEKSSLLCRKKINPGA